MTRAEKAPFQNQKVSTWALDNVARPRGRSGTGRHAANNGELLRVDEAALHLNVSEKTVRRLIKAKALSVIRIGRMVRITPNEIDRFIAAACCPTDTTQISAEEDGHD